MEDRMKILTKLHLLELLKTKEPVAFLRDGRTIDITNDAALSWFDVILDTGSTGYIMETNSFIWIAADKDDYKEEYLWTITRTNQ